MKSASYYIGLLKQYREKNAAKFGIQRIGIFGSVARGEQNSKRYFCGHKGTRLLHTMQHS